MLGARVKNSFVPYSDQWSLEFSKDGGSTWQEILSVPSYRMEEWNMWKSYTQSSPPEYRTASFRFRFVFSTGIVLTSGMSGIFLDDIGIGESTSRLEKMSGTSMAAPFVTGAVALAAARFPGESPLARILENTDSLQSLQGKVITGGRLNLYKTPYEYEEPKGGCSVVGFSPYFFLLALPLAALLKRK